MTGYVISLKMSTKDLQIVQVNAYHASVSSLSLKIYAQLILFIFAIKIWVAWVCFIERILVCMKINSFAKNLTI